MAARVTDTSVGARQQPTEDIQRQSTNCIDQTTTKYKAKQNKQDKKRSEVKLSEDCNPAVFNGRRSPPSRLSGDLCRTTDVDERRSGCGGGGIDCLRSRLQSPGTFVGLRELVADLARLLQSAASDLPASKTSSPDAHKLSSSCCNMDVGIIQSPADSRLQCKDDMRHVAVCCEPVDLTHHRFVNDQRSTSHDVRSSDSFQFRRWSGDKTDDAYRHRVSTSDIAHIASTSRGQQSTGFVAAGTVCTLSTASRLVIDGTRPRTPPLLRSAPFLPATRSSAVAPERFDNGLPWYGPSDVGACYSSVYGRNPHRSYASWCPAAVVSQPTAAAGPLLPLYFDRHPHDVRSMSTLSCCSASTDGTTTCSTPGSQHPPYHSLHRPLMLESMRETPIEIPTRTIGCRDGEAPGEPTSSTTNALLTLREPTDPRRGRDNRSHHRQPVGANLAYHLMPDSDDNCGCTGLAMNLSCVKRPPTTFGSSAPTGLIKVTV